MLTILYFSGFPPCTQSERETVTLLKIVIGLLALLMIYFTTKMILRLKNKIAKYILVSIVPLLIAAVCLVVYILASLSLVGLCT